MPTNLPDWMALMSAFVTRKRPASLASLTDAVSPLAFCTPIVPSLTSVSVPRISERVSCAFHDHALFHRERQEVAAVDWYLTNL
jgi:hypothetical protein